MYQKITDHLPDSTAIQLHLHVFSGFRTEINQLYLVFGWNDLSYQPFLTFWCRIHLWFRLMGGLQAKSMTSQRYRAVTRWRICVIMETLWQQQDGGYALLWKRYDNNDVPTFILHLQQYSHRLNLFCFFFRTMKIDLQWHLFTNTFSWQDQPRGLVVGAPDY